MAQELADDVKEFIVEALARFDAPTKVAEAVKADYGLEVSRQAVQAYDPTKTAGAKLSDALRVHFEKTRKAFLSDLEGIPTAEKAVRLRTLARMAHRAEAAGNILGAAALLEQIAKEVGNVYTRREAQAPGGQTEKPADGLTEDYLAEVGKRYRTTPLVAIEGGAKAKAVKQK